MNRAAPENARRGPAKGQHVGGPGRAGPNRCRSSPTRDATIGDWSTQLVHVALSDRGVPAHQVDADRAPGGRDDVRQHGDHGPGRSGVRRRRRDHPETAVRDHGPCFESTLTRAAATSGAHRHREHHPHSGGQRRRPDQTGSATPAARPRPARASPRWPGSAPAGPWATPAARVCYPAPHPIRPALPPRNRRGRARPRLCPLVRGASGLGRGIWIQCAPCPLTGYNKFWQRRLSGVTC